MAEPAIAHALEPRNDAAPALRAVQEPPPGPTGRIVPRLEIPAYDLGAALRLESELGIGHVLAQLLVRRGLEEPALAAEFLAAAEQHPPAAFTGIERACETITAAVRSGAPITVHGDYDVDGVCATAIMVRALRSLGASVDWFLPGRLEDGYGLSAATVQRLATRGTRLLITVDCAIAAVAEVVLARKLGVEVVVTDHHSPSPDGALPDCAIVHPLLCGYPFPDLCGAAVAHKLALALQAPSAAEDLELVALATVADLMPLRGENRRLVREGLALLAVTGKPGLRALMEVSATDPSALDAAALAFRLGPRINAAGRMRRADAGLELLLTDDAKRAAEIAAELDLLNGERRAVEQRIGWEAEAQVAELGERSAYVLAGEGWHPGVVGIVASRIVERHHRPTVVIGLDGAVGTGSARSIPGFDLLAGLHACAEHLERYGGHRAAAGMTIARERIDGFRAALEAHTSERLTADMLAPVETVDAIACGSSLGLELAEQLALLEPSGLGNPLPRLLVPGARFEDARAIGEGRHARFRLAAGGTRTPAVSFGCDGRVPGGTGEAFDACVRLERNHWNGAVEPRLVLRHAWPCEPAPIEILGERSPYLAAVIEELDRPLQLQLDRQPPGADAGAGAAPPPAQRTILARHGEGPLAVIADARAGGSALLVVCADVERRLEGLRTRTGGFSLVAHHRLELEPELAMRFDQLVVLDPPARETQLHAVLAGGGFTHLAWGQAELRFAQQLHELEFGLRASLVALFRSLRLRRSAAGEELEHLLRGDGRPGRPARLAGRLIRVLAELELVSLNRELQALELVSGAPTALHRSPAYRAYSKRHEDGLRYLSKSGNLPASGALLRR